MANKKTVMQMYEEVLALCATDEQREFIRKRMEITAKKNASGKGGEPTPKQREKLAEIEKMKADVLTAFQPNVSYTATDVLKAINIPGVASTQKLTPLLTALADENKLVKASVKGRTLYSLPSANTADEG